ncbi:MAG: hypothetical protein B6D59_02185 [Campylobacteraceae bacterium 4484_4]|nr:MAG: hypothetical protein B6D59_02185 [Campylobacteraceae bacterium 4484_4]
MSATEFSPIQKITFFDREILLKRDDLLPGLLNGNKARKFHALLHRKLPSVTTVVSHGSAQSNAMASLARVAAQKGWEFHYYTDHVASHLKAAPYGNLATALALGMILHKGRPPGSFGDDTLFVPEGGHFEGAEEGIRILADEIRGQRDPCAIFLPSGTGTTALYLQKHLHEFQVYTTPCVGDAAYLKQQFLELETNSSLHPQILIPPRKYHFGKLYREFFEIWIELKQCTKVTFDLLYDPPGWLTLQSHLELFRNRTLLYLHQGGVEGNESMYRRYQRKAYADN